MGLRVRARTTVFLALCLAAANAADAGLLRVRTYLETEGLPSSGIRSIAQDREGRMWFVTRSGVASYDGGEWRTYGLADGLETLDQRAVQPGTESLVWLVAAHAPLRVSRLTKDDRWETLPSPEQQATGDVQQMEVFEREGREVVAVGTENGLYVWDRAWRKVTPDDGLPGTAVRALEAVGGVLYVGMDSGLYSVSGATIRNLTDKLPETAPGVNGLAASPVDGSLWLANASWLGRLGGRGEFVLERRFPKPLGVDYFTAKIAVSADHHGGVYCGHPTTLLYYHPDEGFVPVDRESGLTDPGAADLFTDREGNIWIAGLRSAQKIVTRRFVSLREEHGLLENEVSAIIERRDGSVLIGHPSGISIVREDGISTRTFGFEHELDLPHRRQELDGSVWSRVLDLAEDEHGDVWVAASWEGLARVDAQDNIEWIRRWEGLSGQVTSVLSAPDGRLWVALSDTGLFVRNRGVMQPAPSAAGVEPRRLFPSRAGGLYVATASYGVGRIENGELRGPIRGETPEENNVYAVLERHDGSVLVGTLAGLRVIEGDRLVAPTPAALRVKRPVYSLTLDRAGRLWCGTDSGILRWDGKTLRRYGVEHGLAGPETNRAALEIDSRGDLWIGTNNGLSIYRERWDNPDPLPPLLSVGSVIAGGQEFGLDGNLDLGAGVDDLTFRVSAVSFADEERILVRSRLEGLDSDWNSSIGRSRRELRYFNISPGKYRLLLEAETVDGAKSDVYASPWVSVAPSFFQRPAVISVIVLFGLTLLYFAQRYLTQRRYAHELEAEIARRTEQIRKFEDQLMRSRRLESMASFVGGVAHDFNNLLSVILGSLSALRRQPGDPRPLKRAEEAVGQATKLTGQFLTFARGGAPVREVADLEALLREAQELVLAGSNVQAVIEIDERLPCAEVDPGQMSQVFNNLLLNAVQAMPGGGSVRIGASSLERAPAPMPPVRAVKISIEDEGPGVPSDLGDRIFEPFFTTKEGGQGLGLASSYSIVNRHGGLLSHGTSRSGGARFDVIVPAHEGRPSDELADAVPATPASGKILVMDDDTAVRSVLEEMLEELGYAVVCTSDGESALARYADAAERDEPFDVAILDLTVRGGMGGAETIRRLAALDPQVRAIVVSGYSEDPVMADPKRYGFRGAIAKPFRSEKLARVILKTLEKDGSITGSA